MTENYSGGIDRFSAIYNFTGQVLQTYAHYHKGSRDIGIKKRYVYDHAGRLIEGYHQVIDNGVSQGEVLLAKNTYNELGQLIEENLHVDNNTAAQSVDYRYNIRGWLESINGSGINDNDSEPDYFSMDLFYNDPLNGVPAGN